MDVRQNMGSIGKALDGSGYIYVFSDDILAMIAELSKLESLDITIRNATAIFLGGSYLEAYLNEQIALHARLSKDKDQKRARQWQTLDQQQSDLSAIQKWSLVTAFTGGKEWDGGVPPFQDYETLVSLRNELVHFKGRWTVAGEPPVKRFKDLVTRFGEDPTIIETAMGVNFWVSALMRSPKLLDWVSQTIFDLEEPIEEFLFCQEPKGDMIRLKFGRRLRWGVKTTRYALPS
jgi:hypothetical protein